MVISILTLFPEMFQGPFAHSIIKHAQEKKLVTINLINIRDFGIGSHKIVDDTPYGGGVGMVMRVDVIHAAIQHALQTVPTQNHLVVLTSAKGVTYAQSIARSFANLDHLIIVCGHYEGVDERVLQYIDQEIAIGEYVLTGGEIPAMVITDSVARLVKGVLKPEATADESFSFTSLEPGTKADVDQSQCKEYPHYTRPQTYQNQAVPEVLLSGDHKKIAEWRSSKRR